MTNNVGILMRQQYSIQEIVSANPSALDGSTLCRAYNDSVDEIVLNLPETLKTEFGRNFKPVPILEVNSDRDLLQAKLNEDENRKVASASLVRLLGWLKGAVAYERIVLEGEKSGM